MQVKTILKALLFSYVVTGLFLLLLAFLLFRFDLGETPVKAGITLIYVISCFAGGFITGKVLQKDRFLWGGLVGVCYFLLLVIVSVAAEGGFDMSIRHIFTTFFMCLGGGMIGGMLS